MSIVRARLVPLYPAAAAVARPYAPQGRGRAVRGREIRLCRADAHAGNNPPGAGAGAAHPQQSRDIGKALHHRRPCRREDTAPRQSRLRACAALALGRRRDGRKLTRAPRALRPMLLNLSATAPTKGDPHAVARRRWLISLLSELPSPSAVSPRVLPLIRLDRSRRHRRSRDLLV